MFQIRVWGAAKGPWLGLAPQALTKPPFCPPDSTMGLFDAKEPVGFLQTDRRAKKHNKLKENNLII